MSPTQVLRDEHRLIERVLDALDAAIEELEGAPFPRAFLERVLDFLTRFSDGSHRAREEWVLFPLLEARGIARSGGPLGTTIGDHDYGRVFLTGVRENLDAAEAGSSGALAAVRDYASAYVMVLRRHIRNEDETIFPRAETLLTDEDMESLRRGFELAPPPPDCLAFAEEIGAGARLG